MSSDPLAPLSCATKAHSCQLTTARVIAIKRNFVESFRLQGAPMPLIREALATAEPLAWLSEYPHLFLPDLAEEILRHLREKQISSHPEYAQAA